MLYVVVCVPPILLEHSSGQRMLSALGHVQLSSLEGLKRFGFWQPDTDLDWSVPQARQVDSAHR